MLSSHIHAFNTISKSRTRIQPGADMKSKYSISTPMPKYQFPFQARIVSLEASKRGQGRSGSKSNSKKRKNSPKFKKLNTKKDENVAKKQKPQDHRPPWQIMSSEDIKKNIKSEKSRRENINAGIASSSDLGDNYVQSGDISASSSILTSEVRQFCSWKRFRPSKDAGAMTFVGAYLGRQTPPLLGVPEVAFLGRSNVGKSSLLNQLASRNQGNVHGSVSQVARVGKTPGATASVNLYLLQSSPKMKKKKPLIGFADCPGFGYAKLSKEVKESVEVAAERYLNRRKELALGILLVDIRRTPSDDDRGILAALYDMNLPVVVVATKIDKMRNAGALDDALESIRMGLGLPEGQPLCISSVTGQGINQLWNIILDGCEEKVDEYREEIENGLVKDNKKEDFDEGYEWVQGFDSNESIPRAQADDSLLKMKQNEEMQAMMSESMKLKSLKKEVRKMERKGTL